MIFPLFGNFYFFGFFWTWILFGCFYGESAEVAVNFVRELSGIQVIFFIEGS